MLENFKSLFVKTDDEEVIKAPSKEPGFSFPVSGNSGSTTQPPITPSIPDSVIKEVLKIYETGLESINMPGYDFYEFYQTISVAGSQTAESYKMAFQMAKMLDKNISIEKLMRDAEFYISKINDVHSQYVAQGQSKLNAINDKKKSEKANLTTEIDQASARIAQLKEEMHKLESDITAKATVLSKIDEGYAPQEKSIKEKLSANDIAHKTSIDKLNIVKEGIVTFIKA